MDLRATRLLCLLAVGGIGSALTLSATAATTTPARGSSTHVLAHSLIPGLADATQVTDLGALPDSEVLSVSVHLVEDQAAEAAAFSAITNKSSPRFGHYLSNAEYLARFSEPTAVTDAAVAQLTAHGLAVTYRSAPGTLLVLRGTAAQLETTFATPLHDYRTVAGKTFRANTAAPTVPASVDAVMGLETLSAGTFHNATTTARATTTAPASTTAPAIAHAQLCAPGEATAGMCTGALTPQDLWAAYSQPSTDRGAGQQIGIVGEGQLDTVVSDLRGFEDTHKLRHMAVREILAGDPETSSDGEGEWALDSAASTGMAPDADGVNYYFADSLSDTGAAFSAWANDTSPSAPMQTNYSVGGCESLNYALGAITADEPIFRQLAMEGRTLFVSTGDTGGSCTAVTGNGFANTGAPMVEWPSSSDAVIAVGGTELFTDGDPSTTRVLEKAWDYTGGGSSDFIQEPSWQSPITTILQPCAMAVVTSTDGGSFCRGLPDVAALSGDITVVAGSAGQTTTTMSLEQGYTDFEGATQDGATGPVTPGAATVDGGTSLASPLWVGMWTRMNAAAGGTLGFAAPKLYAIGESPTKDAADFFDVAVGQNGQHQAEPRDATLDPTGWDYVSGLGVPMVGALTKELAGTSTVTAPVRPASDAVVKQTAPVPTVSCGANGVIPDPAGDVATTATSTMNDAFDLTNVGYAYAGGALTVTDSVVGLADPVDTVLMQNQFVYAGTTYYLNAERDEPGDSGESFLLQTLDPTTFEFDTVATLTGAFDDTANTVTLVLPLTTFNSMAKPATPLAAGSSLVSLLTETSTSTDAFQEDSAALVSASCPYVLGGVPVATAAPTPKPTAAAPTPTTVQPTPAPTTTAPAAATYRTSTLRVGGRGPVHPGEKRTYTLRVFVDPGAGATPSTAGRRLGLYLNGHLRARLLTGRGGTISYTLTFPKGHYVVSAVFYGATDLRRSTSPGQKVVSS